MAKVAVLKTSPDTVVEDYSKLMNLAEVGKFLSPQRQTCLKINISWHHYYPACSTTPWQLEGVVKGLLSAGHSSKELFATHNKTVVVDDRVGERNNGHLAVEQTYGLPIIHLNDPEMEWIQYRPKEKLLVLDQVYPRGIYIPKFLVGKDVVQLPTMKTHVFTTMTGAMKNAFGGLLHTHRHWTHGVIHETLVDLLTISRDIHPGLFAVMDGTIAGDGPGPRAMIPHIKNYILASADWVALDAVAARMMGFDPLSIPFIRLAHERGLGVGDPQEIEMVGEDISGINFGFHGNQNTFASRGQKLIYHGFLKPLEKFLLRSPIVGWSYIASRIYHDLYWYQVHGRRRTKKVLDTEWGALLRDYIRGTEVDQRS
ncbi:DUF362 domain-containing protein [Candidatus Zixiibacteriota bacterium]